MGCSAARWPLMIVTSPSLALRPGSSVAALNHLKRLQGQGGVDAKKGIKQRFQKVFSIFASQAVTDLKGMNVRHHAVLLNALIYQTERDWDGPEAIRGFRSMSNEAADSVSSLLQSGKARRETVKKSYSLPPPRSLELSSD
jgi:hypothetical protein